jgi:hypothetical protein
MQLSGAPGGLAQQGLPVDMQSERGYARKRLDAAVGNQTDLLADRAARYSGQSGVGHMQPGQLPGTAVYNPGITPQRAADVRRGALDAMGTARPNLPQEGRVAARPALAPTQSMPAAPLAPTQVMNQRPANAPLPERRVRPQAQATPQTVPATPGAKAAPAAQPPAPLMPTSVGNVTVGARPAARATVPQGPAAIPPPPGSTPRPALSAPARLTATVPPPKAPPTATLGQVGEQAKKVFNPEAAKGLWNSAKTNPMLRRIGMGAGLAGGALLAGKAISSLMPSKQQQPAVVVQR